MQLNAIYSHHAVFRSYIAYISESVYVAICSRHEHILVHFQSTLYIVVFVTYIFGFLYLFKVHIFIFSKFSESLIYYDQKIWDDILLKTATYVHTLILDR
jgi:membrane-anchored protein YejM (alkaline phosphatase superfamily)